MAQEYKQKQTTKKTDEAEHVEPADLSSDATDNVDDLLAEIDECLGDLTDEEVQVFVDSYTQKGGQ
jgi:Pup-like protein